MAPYIRNGRLVEPGEVENPVAATLSWFWAIVNAIYFFFASLFSIDGSKKYSNYGARRGWGGGSGGGQDGRGPGGGGGGGGGGPRISGMGSLSKGGPPPCGGCGCG